MATHYFLLGVAPKATRSEIRQAYLRLAKQVHPDLASAPNEAAMKLLNEAYATLADPELRDRYDTYLRLSDTIDPVATSRAQHPQPAFQRARSSRVRSDNWLSWADIFPWNSLGYGALWLAALLMLVYFINHQPGEFLHWWPFSFF
jgi:curved DNA-binding protein CbpA